MINKEQGWIKLHRSILDWEWYDEPNTFRLFTHLLLKANHKDKKYRGVTIKVGQVMTGLKLLSEETKLSIQKIRTSLSKLESTNEITINSTSKGTIIQLVNYKKYQVVTNEITINQQTINKQVTTNKNDNNINNKSVENPHTKFTSWFNSRRKAYLELPSNFKRLSYQDKKNLDELTENYDIKDFETVIVNMCNDKWCNENNRIVPQHFLERFENYLAKEQKPLIKKQSKLMKGWAIK